MYPLLLDCFIPVLEIILYTFELTFYDFFCIHFFIQYTYLYFWVTIFYSEDWTRYDS